MPLPGNMPKVLGLIGPYARSRELAEALGALEPVGFIDMDAPLHEALTDLKFNPGDGEDIDWNELRFQDEVSSLRNWVLQHYSWEFLAHRAFEQIVASGDSHSLYIVPNLRYECEHEYLKKNFRSYEYMSIHIREASWEPLTSDAWASIEKYVMQFEVGDTPLLDQLLHILDPNDTEHV